LQRDTANDLDARLNDRLAATWLTHDLDGEARAALAGLGSLTNVAPNEVLMREGEINDVLAIVLEGRVSLRVRVPERGQVTILTVEVGDVVGWSAMVPPYRATSTAVALVDTELAVFDGPRLRAALAADERLAAQLYPVLLKAVARRLEGTRLQLLDLFSQRWVEPW
jgi:CRP-like cAMP-binding protein